MPPHRKKIMLTGFGPFPGVQRNATEKYVPELAKASSEKLKNRNIDIAYEILPAQWKAAPTRAVQAITHIRPHLILHFGVAKDIDGFAIERIARNTCAISPDACDEMPEFNCVEPNGPKNLYVSIPAQHIVHRLRLQGYPAELSKDAGEYICNAVFYTSLRTAQAAGTDCQIGFTHLPEDLGRTSCALTWNDALRGGVKLLELCIEKNAIAVGPALGPNCA